MHTQVESMNQNIVQLLRQTYTSSDTHTVNAATRQLFSYANIQGFLPALMEISTNTNADHNLTIAALSQLKNCIRTFWNCSPQIHEIYLDQHDKQYLKNNIISLNIVLSDNDKYGKIIKDIIAIIALSLYDNMEQVISMLRNGEELRTCLNFLLGTIDYFRCHQVFEQEKSQICKDFMCESVPSLTKLVIQAQKQLNTLYEQTAANPTSEMVQNYKNQSQFMEQIMYLSIKFMSKIIEKDVPLQIREYAFQWGEVCLNRLNDTNQQMHSTIKNEECSFWPKRSKIFIYFHSRKWAIEYLYRFLNRVLVYKRSQPQISQLTKRFYYSHLNILTDVITNLFMQYQSPRIRVRQLKLLQKLFTNKPKHMKQFLPYYQFEVLPNYIYFDQQDYNLARNPIQFLGYEEEGEDKSFETENLRGIAAGLWVQLTVEYAQREQPNNKGQIYAQSFNYIFRLLELKEKRHQLAGVYLMWKLSKKIRQQDSHIIGQALSELTNYILQHFLKCEDLLLQSKTLQVFIKNNIFISRPVRRYVLDFILSILQKQVLAHTSQLIKINAIIALQMFQQEELIIVDQLKVRDLVEIYLDMIVIYQLESITESFKVFMNRLGERSMPHAIFVIKQLGQIIKTIDLKVTQPQNKPFQIFKIANKSGVWSAAIDTLGVLSDLINKQTSEVKAALQEQLQNLLSQYFTADLAQESHIVQLGIGIFYFLNKYLEIIKYYGLQLPPRIRFFSMVLRLKMSKLPTMFLMQNNEIMSYPPKKIVMLQYCCHHQDFLMLDYMKSMKLFISFFQGDVPIRGVNQIRANLLKSSDLEQFFYMVFSYYQKRSQQQQDLDAMISEYRGRIVVTILLIYLLQEHSPVLRQPAYQNILLILRLNQKVEELKKYIGRYNRQLFYIWFWAFCPKYIIQKNKQYKNCVTKYVIHVLQNTTRAELNTSFFEQKRRILLGHCSLLLATIFVPQLRIYQDNIIQTLFKITKKILCYTGVLVSDENDEQPYQNIRMDHRRIRQNPNDHVTSDEPQIDEPNYLIELSQESKDQIDYLEDELDREFNPEQIYDGEYSSRLDDTITNEFLPFFESLSNFQKYDPEGYRTKIHQTGYGVLLNEMLQASERSSDQYRLYEKAMISRQEYDG